MDYAIQLNHYPADSMFGLIKLLYTG